MHTEVGSVDGLECFGQVGEGRLPCRDQSLLGGDDTKRPAIRHHGETMRAALILAHSGWRHLGNLDLGNQVAAGGGPAWELDARRLADGAATAIGADHVVGAQPLVVRKLELDTAVVLAQPGDLVLPVHRHTELQNPRGQDRLEAVLPEGKPVRMARGEVTDVEHGGAEACGLSDVADRKKAIRNPALVEDLDRARVDATRPGTQQLSLCSSFDNVHVDAGERKLSGEHHAGRPGTHHCYVGHASPSPRSSPPRCSSVGPLRGLAARPGALGILKMQGDSERGRDLPAVVQDLPTE